MQDNVTNLNIDAIIANPHQPRKQFNDISLNELAVSIKSYGILNPILVRKKDNYYEIIAGERRYRAAKMLGLSQIPAIIKDVDDQKMSEIATIENIQRENINSIEEAKSYQNILNSNNITEKELSELIGKSQPFISNKIRLLNLDSKIQTALIDKKISEKHARSLLKINDKAKQIELFNKVINEKLSVRELDNLINNNQKEEKESDNMNNGNFFPNFNNQPNTNNMTLNSMNMQTINSNQHMAQQPEQNNTNGLNQFIPETPTILNFDQTTQNIEMPQTVPSPSNQFETNPGINPVTTVDNNPAPSAIPNLNIENQPVSNQTEMIGTPINSENIEANQQNNQFENIPLFNEPNFASSSGLNSEVVGNQSQINNLNEPPQTPTNNIGYQSMTETPLFNQELNSPEVINQTNNQSNNINESFYEVPVNISPVIEEQKTDKVTQIQQLLSGNGIEYKTYSNENGHCIIIEF